MRKILNYWIILVIVFLMTPGYSQTLDELRRQKADLEAKMAPVKAETDAYMTKIADIDKQISNFPGWYTGAFGTLGANFQGRNNWFNAGDLLNSTSTTLSGSFNAFANKIDDKYFWRSAAGINLGWQRLKLTKDAEDADFEPVADVFNITSLFGYKLNSQWALSALGEYKTSIIRQFNDPGYLDIGVGATYTPIKNMVISVHPLNYNLIFSKESTQFNSSLGSKIMADYTTEIIQGLNWRTNLSGFLSYKNQSPSLHNGTWTNWIGLNVWKGLGVGVEFGLRYSQQENFILRGNDNSVGVDAFQNYYTVGLSYKL
jgi:hypothetical protein